LRAPLLCIGAPAGQGSHAPQERGIKVDFGAAKMRFDEGEERAARVSYYGLPAFFYFFRSGLAEERSRAAADSRKQIYLQFERPATSILLDLSIRFDLCAAVNGPHFASHRPRFSPTHPPPSPFMLGYTDYFLHTLRRKFQFQRTAAFKSLCFDWGLASSRMSPSCFLQFYEHLSGLYLPQN
jgi:hypothetical protein